MGSKEKSAGKGKGSGALAREAASEDGLARALLSEGLAALRALPDACADVALTDPPYGIDQLGEGWEPSKVKKSQGKAGAMGGLPVGMKFDPGQGPALQAFLEPFFKELYRVLKPGGFLLCFSQARLYHRVALAAEEAGFEARDMLGWVYEGQAKAFTQDHFVRKMKASEERKAEILKSLGGRKTPQLKPMIEPIALGQKPREGTFVENWMAHGVGLIDASALWEGRFPGNLIECAKPSAKERGEGNEHPTVKPVAMLAQLIRIFAPENGLVVDPFAGSGSTLVAARATGRRAWGAEMQPDYFEIIKRRLAEAPMALDPAPAAEGASAGRALKAKPAPKPAAKKQAAKAKGGAAAKPGPKPGAKKAKPGAGKAGAKAGRLKV